MKFFYVALLIPMMAFASRAQSQIPAFDSVNMRLTGKYCIVYGLNLYNRALKDYRFYAVADFGQPGIENKLQYLEFLLRRDEDSSLLLKDKFGHAMAFNSEPDFLNQLDESHWDLISVMPVREFHVSDGATDKRIYADNVQRYLVRRRD